MLKNNIKKHLEFNNFLDYKISWTRDKLELEMQKENSWDIIKILKNIPWIAYILEVDSYLLYENEEQKNDKNFIFDNVFQIAKKYYLEKIENKSFVARVKRVWEHNFSSTDLERYVWWGLLKFSKNAKVSLKNPDLIVKIEILDNRFFIIKDKIEALWGYPIWFQDKVVSLISGWFDSWVSTFSLMKRWAKVDYLFFNLWGSAHELGVKQVAHYLWKTFSVSYSQARFITVDFEEVISELLTKVNHKFRWVLLKRFMLKVASMVAENNYYALVKWDSLGQVSSQTLKNMAVIDKASDCLVLRPLIWYNKQEIVDITKEIWTYNFACNMPEYCGVISDKPATWATMQQVIEEEENLKEEVLKRAFEWRKIIKLKEIFEENFKNSKEIEKVYFAEDNEIIIDIREEDDKKKKPLKVENAEILEIPFFEINSSFKKLDQTKTYLLYCDKWVLSELHWLYLKELGFENVKIFRKLEDKKTCKK
jgi:thiamine biosynthesis protein ThiI